MASMTRRHEGTPSEKNTVTVKVFGGLREVLGAPERPMTLPDVATLSDLFARLEADVPALSRRIADGLEKGFLNVLINGRNARFLQGTDTPLHDGDAVAFLPPIGGG
jgi:MoaD family protein